jgi:predicted permease
MRIALKAGRLPRDADAPPAQPVVLISEGFAKKYYPAENPLGQRIDFGLKSPAEIIGVVGDVRHGSLDADPPATIYVPQAHTVYRGLYFAVRTATPPESLIPAVRAAIHDLDASIPLDAVGTVSSLVDTSLSQQRLTTLLLGIFAALALLLAMIGIYGVLAYAVNQAAPELGIRIALGAKSADILRIVLGYGGVLMLAGVAAGTIGALLLGRALAAQLFEVKATDPVTYGLVALTLAATGLAACFVPAWRALRVDPLRSIRGE